MTHLQLVRTTAPDIHSRKVEQTMSPERESDFRRAAQILGTIQDAARELADAIANGRHDLLVPCERRCLAAGLVAGDHAAFLEKEPA